MSTERNKGPGFAEVAKLKAENMTFLAISG